MSRQAEIHRGRLRVRTLYSALNFLHLKTRYYALKDLRELAPRDAPVRDLADARPAIYWVYFSNFGSPEKGPLIRVLYYLGEPNKGPCFRELPYYRVRGSPRWRFMHMSQRRTSWTTWVSTSLRRTGHRHLGPGFSHVTMPAAWMHSTVHSAFFFVLQFYRRAFCATERPRQAPTGRVWNAVKNQKGQKVSEGRGYFFALSMGPWVHGYQGTAEHVSARIKREPCTGKLASPHWMVLVVVPAVEKFMLRNVPGLDLLANATGTTQGGTYVW